MQDYVRQGKPIFAFLQDPGQPGSRRILLDCSWSCCYFPAQPRLETTQLHLDGDLGGGSNSFRWGAPFHTNRTIRTNGRRAGGPLQGILRSRFTGRRRASDGREGVAVRDPRSPMRRVRPADASFPPWTLRASRERFFLNKVHFEGNLRGVSNAFG